MAIRGWTSPNTSVRKEFGFGVDITAKHPGDDNREVSSKSTRRYGRNETTGEQPADLYRDPVNGDVPVTHHPAIAQPHVETVGWHPDTGQFVHSTHPNAQKKAAGDAKRTHAALEPVGMTHSKYGGEHGEPQKRPEGENHGGRTAKLGPLNTPRDRNRGRKE